MLFTFANRNSICFDKLLAAPLQRYGAIEIVLLLLLLFFLLILENIAGAKRYSRPRGFNIARASAAVAASIPTPLTLSTIVCSLCNMRLFLRKMCTKYRKLTNSISRSQLTIKPLPNNLVLYLYRAVIFAKFEMSKEYHIT